MKLDIAGILKRLRRSSGYSATKVAEMLKEYEIYISAKTIYGYERGVSMPNANVFLALCQIYDCDNPLEPFDREKASLSSSEESLVDEFRQLDEFGKGAVDLIVGHELERTQASKVVELSTQTQSEPDQYNYPYMNKIAAAGVGFYFDDIPTDTIYAPYCEGADFVIGVSGDSMEPTYYDGDLVYVQKTTDLRLGEVGIFVWAGECYIKEYGRKGLISHNKKYKIIPGNEDIITVGKVLGKVD